ncbi:MAG: hypothetical protein EBZ13_03290 [Planctomycetia bacterium]|nr:hypothetical protein [Planctomycetia bacterium]
MNTPTHSWKIPPHLQLRDCTMPDRFSEILVNKGIISQEQLTEATKVAGDSGKKLHEEILRLGYAPPARVMKALAKANRMAFTDLEGMTVPDEVIDLVPESVARENTILPLREEGTMLQVATSDPTDIDTQEKLRFILNREVEMTLAMRDQIVESINRHYGSGDGESADSMLTQEFTDTEIDFTETTVEQEAALKQDEDERYDA